MAAFVVFAGPLGNNRVLADGGGNPLALHDYDPYGEEVNALTSGMLLPLLPGMTDSPYKYGGKEWTAMTSTYDFEARQLAPSFHRFTTMDPLAQRTRIMPSTTDNLYAHPGKPSFPPISGRSGRTNPLKTQSPCTLLQRTDTGVCRWALFPELKIDTTKMKKPSFLMVFIGVGEIAHRRNDGVYVVPLGCLKD